MSSLGVSVLDKASGTGINVIASVRGNITTNASLSFDLNTTNNFSRTTATNGTLTFTNIAAAAGQSGFIVVVNTNNHTISAAANTRINSADLANISQTGTYVLSYFCNGTDVFVTASRSL